MISDYRFPYRRRKYKKAREEWYAWKEELIRKIEEIRKKYSPKGIYNDDIEGELKRWEGAYGIKNAFDYTFKRKVWRIERIRSQILDLRTQTKSINIDEKFLFVYDLPKQITIFKD